LIGAEGARLLWEYGAGETPQALKRRGGSPAPARPRKASVWGGNQQPKLTEPNKKVAIDKYRYLNLRFFFISE